MLVIQTNGVRAGLHVDGWRVAQDNSREISGSLGSLLGSEGKVQLGLGLEQGYKRVSTAGVGVRSWTTEFQMS